MNNRTFYNEYQNEKKLYINVINKTLQCHSSVFFSMNFSFISYNSFHEYCLIFVCFVFVFFSTYILDKIVNVLCQTDLQLDVEDFWIVTPDCPTLKSSLNIISITVQKCTKLVTPYCITCHYATYEGFYVESRCCEC